MHVHAPDPAAPQRRSSLDENGRTRLFTDSVRGQLYSEVDDDPIMATSTVCDLSTHHSSTVCVASGLAQGPARLQRQEPDLGKITAHAAKVQAAMGTDESLKFAVPSAATGAGGGNAYAVRQLAPRCTGGHAPAVTAPLCRSMTIRHSKNTCMALPLCPWH